MSEGIYIYACMRRHIFLCGGRWDNSPVLSSRRREYLVKVITLSVLDTSLVLSHPSCLCGGYLRDWPDLPNTPQTIGPLGLPRILERGRNIRARMKARLPG